MGAFSRRGGKVVADDAIGVLTWIAEGSQVMWQAQITASIPVVDPWEEPLEWQEARPSVFVRGNIAYVNDPAASKIHAVDLATGEVTAEVDLPNPANEMTGV